jgi:predicted MPP superfamily phosphohydrolase
MPPSLRFILVRSIILALLIGSQLYLFVKGDRALRRSRLSPRRRSQLRFALAGFFLAVIATYLVLLLTASPLQRPSSLMLYGLLYPTAIWAFGSLFSFLFLASADLIGWLATKNRVGNSSRAAGPIQPADPSRRRFVQTSLTAIATAPVFASGYGAAFEGTRLRVEEVRLPLSHGRTLHPPLTVVQVSDIHSGVFMTPERMRQCAEVIQRFHPDLFLLTGDYITNSMAYLAPCAEAMGRVRARYGSFAVLGNHEHWHGEPEEVIDAFDREGIRVLQNANRVLDTDRGPVAVAGIDDLRFGRPDLDRALQGLDPGVPTILLSHRPEIFPDAAARNVELTLAGHYHGGQVKLALFGFDLSLAHLLSPYTEGLYRLGDSRLYVNRGLGTTGTPVRLNAPPEITVFRLI